MLLPIVDSIGITPLCTIEELDEAYDWLCDLRIDYSPNSDIWNLRRHWKKVKPRILKQLNEGSYTFSPLTIYTFKDGVMISLWTSEDMLALKIITNALFRHMEAHIPASCYHVKGHGGLKKAVEETYGAIPQYTYVLRSDVKGYYDSIDFTILMSIIRPHVQDTILLDMILNACHRTETSGGIFTSYENKGVPMGSPLSPLLGAIALMPLDQAMEKRGHHIFYGRYMDDWVVLTYTKTALRKVIKQTHQILKELRFTLHPTKTYIGKISHGFNFLGYYMDDQKILPSKETIRRYEERATALYEQGPVAGKGSGKSKKNRRRHKTAHGRDISEYHVNEEPPQEQEWVNFKHNRYLDNPGDPRSVRTLAQLRVYLSRWARWLAIGLGEVQAFFMRCLLRHMPTLAAVSSLKYLCESE